MSTRDLYKTLIRIANELAGEDIEHHIVNLTPHALNLHRGEEVVTIPPSGKLARLSHSVDHVGSIRTQYGMIDRYSSSYGEIEGLPEPSDKVIYVVSGLVRGELDKIKKGQRPDVLAIKKEIRNEKGHTVGAWGIGH